MRRIHRRHPPVRAPSARVNLSRLLDEALKRRAGVASAADTNAWRVLHGGADGVEGLVLEKHADVLVAQFHEGPQRLPEEQARELCAMALRRLGASAVYRKNFARDRSASVRALEAEHYAARAWIGADAPEEITVLERGMRFLIRPYDGLSVGLFLDQRDNRTRVAQTARGARVLNLFAYTCGFSVAAALGGASETTSVDISRRHLEWGKRNFAANGVPLDAQRFIASDALEYFGRAARQGRAYDLVVLDPPTFARSKKPARVFVLEERLEELFAGAVSVLAPGGRILFSTNLRALRWARIEAAARHAAQGRSIRALERCAPLADFHGDERYSRGLILSVAGGAA